MDCEEVRELLDAYALGALEREQSQHVDQHLAACVECRSFYQQSEEVAGFLALAAPLRQADPGLRLRLLSRVSSAGKASRFTFRHAWAAAAAVLLAVSLGALSWDAVLQNRVSDLQTDNDRLTSLVTDGARTQVSLVATQEALFSQQAEVEAALYEQNLMLAVALDDEAHPYEMSGMGTAAAAQVRYAWSSQHSLGILYATNLPEAPAGMVYQFWLLTEDRAVDGGTFAPEDDGRAQLLVRDPSIEAPVIAIEVSLEPEGGSEAPTGDTVLYGERQTQQ